jgi:hypothetical protein
MLTDVEQDDPDAIQRLGHGQNFRCAGLAGAVRSGRRSGVEKVFLKGRLDAGS